jgi:hypothetical protein
MTDQSSTIPIPTNEEIGKRIISDLLTIPDELLKAESFQSALREQLSDAEAALKDAELNAQINAPMTGANAEKRKLDSAAAVAASPEVKAARQKVIEFETAIAAQENGIKQLSRRFNASMQLADYMAARINLSARVQKTPISTK